MTSIKTPERRKKIIEKLRSRDGDNCFYCKEKMLFPLTPVSSQDVDGRNPNLRTIEHLIPKSHGGTNQQSNLVLVHSKCNHLAGNLSKSAKIKRYFKPECQA